MKKLNEKGVSIVEIIVTFALIMIIVSGLLTIIMNYRGRMQSELKRLDLVSFKDSLTKDIQTDIIDKGLSTINKEGQCIGNENIYDDCINIVFKDGVEKILATSKTNSNNIDELKDLLNNKYIKYGDFKYEIEDKLPNKIPVGKNDEETINIIKSSQNIYMNSENFLTSDSAILADGKIVKIYSIDIYMEHIDYNDDYGIHIVTTDNDTLTANFVATDFKYTGNVQEYVAPANGTYKIEVWGASGGDFDSFSGGLGSYVSGYTYINKGTTLYIYVGGQGSSTLTIGGYNGGGDTTNTLYGASGGGATDVRLVGGEYSNFDSLKSRIIVAAGGAGANNRNNDVVTGGILYGAGDGGAAGGLIGYDGNTINYKKTAGFESFNEHTIGTGGTQNAGGQTKILDSQDTQISASITGGFGVTVTPNESGAGGGWFTGGNSSNGAAGGGSSYISGHEGCLALNQSSTETNIVMKTDSEYAGYHFDNTVMIDGNGYNWTNKKENKTSMPIYDGKTGDVGNKGNGYARITYLGA